jgi:hypothetical protein
VFCTVRPPLYCPSQSPSASPQSTAHANHAHPCRNTHLELGVETGSLVRALGDLVGLGLLPRRATHLYCRARV